MVHKICPILTRKVKVFDETLKFETGNKIVESNTLLSLLYRVLVKFYVNCQQRNQNFTYPWTVKEEIQVLVFITFHLDLILVRFLFMFLQSMRVCYFFNWKINDYFMYTKEIVPHQTVVWRTFILIFCSVEMSAYGKRSL